MARFYGRIGFGVTEEVSDGIHESQITERSYYGDVVKNTRKLENGIGVNDDINVANIISIRADAYAYDNFFAIRYVHWMGARWKVTQAEVQRPRLILTIGGLYNGPTN